MRNAMEETTTDYSPKTFEHWIEQDKPAAWLAASTRAAFRIPVGKEMTHEEFKTLLEKTGKLEMHPAAPLKKTEG